ncbi:PREDICTED: poly [ADP-ribose] polymerase 4 [Gekko japonicus]|uniref:Poly [ADP-ribose] polymerase n=1 Tax=Gekko japonicus TaxID=146911 RepID=A0ABM1LG96_GEKJA|nr:PREDICTED: poly [ADP-ribose] polymerase 4 [Gekko japonicus]
MPEPIFTNCGFFLKLKKITIQEKNKLKDCIKENGGQITFAINDKCTHVVTDDADALSSVHLKTIKKKQLPTVDVNFIWDSVKENRLLPPSDSEPLKALESTPDVKIVSVCLDDSQKVNDGAKNGSESDWHDSESDDSSKSDDSSNTDELRWFSNNDKNTPYFPEDFEVAKYDVLEKVTAQSEYVVVELQCALQCCDYPFRIHTCYSILDGVKYQKQWTSTKTSEEARRAYVLCMEELKKADFELRHDFPREAEHLASTKLQEMLVVEAISSGTLSEEVGVFVELIWAEALGVLKHLLRKPVTSISLNDVSKAEGVLLRAKKALDEGKSPNELTAVLAEFYTIIPHKSEIDYNVCKKLLSNKQDLCQLIRDMLNVHEISMSHPDPPSLSKYRSLGCKIDVLDINSDEFNNVKEQVVQNNFSKCPIEVLQIYNVSRRMETAAFESTLGNIQPLLHASSPSNFVGILSRGLLLPKMVVEEHGIERTDSGNLGCGVYFSNSISTSIKYSQPNKTDGTRLLVICDVALGRCLDTYQKDLSLTTAPSGYESVHGIRQAKGNDSAFQDDEFVVYRTSQIKMKYVVKFRLADDKVEEFHPIIQVKLEDQAPVPEHQAQPKDYEMPRQNMLNNIAAGLLDRSGNPIPLKEVHIKGRIIDFVAQVVVFQTYENTSDSPIEAKYVFPLDDTAAVCGFEAFIKGKHIIGEVKEKEVAHREYRDAVTRGDGAYLMDQDAPDIFTVSVGNLPPSTRVLIKITYITELAYDDRNLSFLLPAAVAPWQQDKALNENTQDTVTKVAIKQIGTKPGGFSLEMSVEMPFKIDYIDSWTHKLKIKKTDCKAVIHTVEDSSLGVAGFALGIGIGDVHLPRMWVEKHPDKETEACMLVFQPQFAVPYEPSSPCGETIICLDCSNSMAGSEMRQAKQIALHALESCHFLPRLSVIKFGTNFVHFPFSPGKYKVDVTALKEFVSSATPSMGNSDLWKALHYLSLLYPSKGKRSILLISDGHIQNEAMTLQTVKENARHTRIFTCGVGYAANRHMLRSLSQYGAGTFEYFDAKTKYNWERKIGCQISRMHSRGCSAVSIKWQQFDTNAPEPTYAPAQIQSLFINEYLLVYGFISQCTQATLKALIDNQELQTMVSTTELQKRTGTMLHKLTARALIRDYEQGVLHENKTEHEMKKQQLKSLIIKLSLENSIVTQFTSFVAIEKRDGNEDQGADTLNVSELVAKEDVDILPYMQYQVEDDHLVSVNSLACLEEYDFCFGEMSSSVLSGQNLSPVSVDRQEGFPPPPPPHQQNAWVNLPVEDGEGERSREAPRRSTEGSRRKKPEIGLLTQALDYSVSGLEGDSSSQLLGQKFLKAGRLTLDHQEPYADLSSLFAAPLALEADSHFSSSLSSGQPFSSPSAIPTRSDAVFGSSAVSKPPDFPVQGIYFGGGHPALSQGRSLLLTSNQSPLPATTTGFGSALTPTLKGLPGQGMVLQSGPPESRGTLFSAPPFLSAPPSTEVPVPAAGSSAPSCFMSRIKAKVRPPVPVQDQLSSPSGPQLLPFNPFVNFNAAPPAAPPVVQFEPGSGAPMAARRAMPLPEDQWPLLRLKGKKPPARLPSPPSLGKASAEPKSIALFGKQPEETLQNFIEKKRRSKKKVCRMPAVQKTLSAVFWPQLSELQNQDGYWQLTPELGTLLDLDVNDLVNVSLTKRGIQSLGLKGKEKLLQLIATLLVLQVVRLRQLEGITFKSLMKLNDSPPSRAFDAVKKAVEWAKRTHQQFPAICQRLELGKDWDSATKKLLGIEITGTARPLANSK